MPTEYEITERFANIYKKKFKRPMEMAERFVDNMKEIYNKVEDCLDVMEDYIEFICRLSLLDGDSDGFQAEYGMQGVAYTQCLIPNTGDDGECENDTFGDETTTITVGTLLGYSGLYQLTPDFNYSDFENHSSSNNVYWDNNPTIYESYKRLTPEAANRIINYIKNYCGPIS